MKSEIIKQIEEFKIETGIELEIKDGNPYYGSSIDLENIPVTKLPDNLKVKGCLNLDNTNIKELPDNLTLDGFLSIEQTQIKKLPENLVILSLYAKNSQIKSLPESLGIKGSIILSETEIEELPDNMKLDNLIINKTKIKSLPKNLVIGDDLDITETEIEKLPEDLIICGSITAERCALRELPKSFKVGGCFSIRETNIQSLPDGLTVGGNLFIIDTPIKSLPKNMIVGKNLYIKGTLIQSLPEDSTIGGTIFIENSYVNNIDNINKNIPDILEWGNGKYIKCDGISSAVISHKGNVYKLKSVGIDYTGKEWIYYLVGDGNGKWAHGKTIKEAKRDLIYKISNRDKSKYKNLNLDSVLSYEEAIECYRVITGACEYGTRGFIENELSEKKGSYTIGEIIRLTNGKYRNSEFKKFFTNKKK